MSAIVVTLTPHADGPLANVQATILGNLLSPLSNGVLGFTFDETVDIQVPPPNRAAGIRVFDRITRTTQMTIKCAKLHANLGDAFLWVMDHTQKIPGKVNLKFEWAGKTRYLNGCGVPRRSLDTSLTNGITTVFDYQIIGGQVVTAANL